MPPHLAQVTQVTVSQEGKLFIRSATEAGTRTPSHPVLSHSLRSPIYPQIPAGTAAITDRAWSFPP